MTNNELIFAEQYIKSGYEIWIKDGRIDYRENDGNFNFYRYNFGVAYGVYDACRDFISVDYGGVRKRLQCNIFWQRIGRNCSGMTLGEVILFVRDNVEIFKLKKGEALKMDNELCVGIHDIDIRREYGNKNKNTFDFVKVEVLLKRMPTDEKIRKLKENKSMIVDYAREELGKKKAFTKYGVPAYFLKDYAWSTYGNSVFIDFCLKEVG